jgi:transcription antitermination factor NusG
MPNSEKKIITQLLKYGVETFLPLVTKVVQWSDRKKKVSVPLFSGYLFVKTLRADDMRRVAQTNGVIRFLSSNGKLEKVSASEISTIQKIIDHAPVLEVGHFEIGQEIEIGSGYFTGIKGQLIRRNGRNKLVVSVSSIQQCVMIEIPIGDVIRTNTLSPIC